MVNFRVVRLGDVLRNLVKVVILIGCIMIFARFFSGIKKINFQQFVENRKRELLLNVLRKIWMMVLLKKRWIRKI